MNFQHRFASLVLATFAVLGSFVPAGAAEEPPREPVAAPLLALAPAAEWTDPPICCSPASRSNLCRGTREPSCRTFDHGPRGHGIQVNLTVSRAKNSFDGKTVELRSFNGGLIGPTLLVRTGESLRVDLVNDLKTAHMREVGGVLLDLNATNLHTHGLHVSPGRSPKDPTRASDDVMLTLYPDKEPRSQGYQFDITPDHEAGTFWYHAHQHGSTAIQLASGMLGALLVEGAVDDLPALRAANDRLFVFEQFGKLDCPPGKDACYIDEFSQVTRGAYTAINGRLKPRIALRAGEVERWRFIHGGITQGLRLGLRKAVDGTCGSIGGAGVTLAQIGIDGITLPRVRPLNAVQMYPGYRSDVLVRIPPEARDGDLYCLYDLPETDPKNFLGESTEAESAQVLAEIVVRGRTEPMAFVADADLARLAKKPLPCDGSVPGTPQSVTFAQQGSPFFSVDGKVYDHHAPPRELILGQTAEWKIQSGVANHPFHVHVNPFTVCRENGRPVEPYWRDTVFVRAGRDSDVVFRTSYEEYVGTFVLHCHILAHEDQGMMQKVRIQARPKEAAPPQPSGAE